MLSPSPDAIIIGAGIIGGSIAWRLAQSGLAVTLIGKGLVDVKPLISATLAFANPTEAFDLAMDRSRSMKVQLAF